MKVISGLTMVLYSLFFFLIGVVLVLISLNIFTEDAVSLSLSFLYSSMNMRLATGVMGVTLVGITLLAMQVVVGKMQRERTIAFDNPDGQVTISLGAVEDFIKRLVKQIPEIKELKPTVVANKKGVDVMTRLILFSDTNIPEVTDRLQSLIKGRVQEILGIEEAISIKVHIIKIVQKEEHKEPRLKETEQQSAPFRGIEY